MSPQIFPARSLVESPVCHVGCVDHVDQICEEQCDNRTLHMRVQIDAVPSTEFIHLLSHVIEQKIPEAKLLVMVEGQSIIIRVHHCQIKVFQCDTLAYRIARLAGVRHLQTTLNLTQGPALYAGNFRGRSDTVIE